VYLQKCSSYYIIEKKTTIPLSRKQQASCEPARKIMTDKLVFKPWGGTMTARERFNAQMHFKPFDRCFNMEFGYWDENFHQWKMFVDNNIHNNWEADRFFAFDPYAGIGGNYWMHPGFPTDKWEENGHTYMHNGDGVLCEVLASGDSTIPHYIKSSVTTPDDWKRVKEERFRRDDPVRKPDIEALKKRHPQGPARTYPLGIGVGSMIGKVRDMLTMEGLAYATFDYPEMVEDMVETCCVLVEDFLDQVLPYFDFDYASSWEDICFKNGPLITLDFFDEVVVPRYSRINKKLKEHGIDLWWCDCDGDVRPLLHGFLEGGINCLFPYEVMGCTHPGRLLDEYQGVLHIMGGFDKMQLGAGRKAIKDYMETLIPYVERGGFIPFCDHRCPPNVKEEDYLYYLDLKRQVFGGGF
jgi:uroporphyrinogen decarboxylase